MDRGGWEKDGSEEGNANTGVLGLTEALAGTGNTLSTVADLRRTSYVMDKTEH